MPDLRNMKVAPFAIGGGVFLTCTLATILLGDYALSSDEAPPFDRSTARAMKDMGDARPAKGVWMAWVTHLGDNMVLAAVAALGVLWNLIRRKWWLAAAWAVIALGGQAINDGVKNWAQRERPPVAWRDPAVTTPPRSFSFPSGHALGSTVIYGLLGYTMLLEAKRRLYVIMVMAEVALIVGAVGFSRVYLRVHWASDVMAGFLIGAAWLGLSLGLLESWRRRVRNSAGVP